MANRRFEMHQYRQVIVRMRQGDTDRDIARIGLMGRRKAAEVRAAATEYGWLEVSQPLPDEAVVAEQLARPVTRPQTVSQVQPFAAEVKAWYDQELQGTTIFQALRRKLGFQGSYSAVRRYLSTLPPRDLQVTTPLNFAPGDTGQVDFGKGPRIIDVSTGEVIDTWIFCLQLAWSRHLYAELVRDQRVPTWLGCHRRAFEYFHGVPVRLIIDSLKSAITRACYYEPTVQRAYAECAEGYGFLLAPHPPREPEKKGRIESSVKYVKRAFVPLREFRSLADGNQQLRQWLLGEAGNRLHGTTRERPLTRFTEVERHLLQPLPASPPELVEWATVKVHGDGHVQFQYGYYSVPYQLVRQQLWLRAGESTVRVYRDHELVALHPRLLQPGRHATIDAHRPPEAIAYLTHDAQWCLHQAEQTGSACHQVIQALFADRVMDNLRAAQGLIGLRHAFGPGRLEAACARALAYGTPKYRTVKTILHQGLDQEPLPTPQPRPLAAVYTGKSRFCRDQAELLSSVSPS